jgi:hypothetical protein
MDNSEFDIAAFYRYSWTRDSGVCDITSVLFPDKTRLLCKTLNIHNYYTSNLEINFTLWSWKDVLSANDVEFYKSTVSTLVEGCKLFILEIKNQLVFRLFYDNEDKCVCCAVIFMIRIICQKAWPSLRQFSKSEYIYQYIIIFYLPQRATRWSSWLKHCATSRKVAGRFPMVTLT